MKGVHIYGDEEYLHGIESMRTIPHKFASTSILANLFWRYIDGSNELALTVATHVIGTVAAGEILSRGEG